MAELTRDDLTQVRNRRGFVRALGLEFERAKRYGRPASLVVLGVDRFQEINDTYGQPAADQVLRDLALSLTHLVRSSDEVFRLGDDEFAILLPETDHHSAAKVVEKLRTHPCATIPSSPPQSISLSVGHRALDDEVQDAHEWYALAGRELSRVKGNGQAPG